MVRGMVNVNDLVDAAQARKLWIMSRVALRSCRSTLVDLLAIDNSVRIVAGDVVRLSGVIAVLRYRATDIVSFGSCELKKMVHHVMRSFVGSAASVDICLVSDCDFRLPPGADDGFFDERVDVFELSIFASCCLEVKVLAGMVEPWRVMTIMLEATSSDIQSSVVSQILIPLLFKNKKYFLMFQRSEVLLTIVVIRLACRKPGWCPLAILFRSSLCSSRICLMFTCVREVARASSGHDGKRVPVASHVMCSNIESPQSP